MVPHLCCDNCALTCKCEENCKTHIPKLFDFSNSSGPVEDEMEPAELKLNSLGCDSLRQELKKLRDTLVPDMQNVCSSDIVSGMYT